MTGTRPPTVNWQQEQRDLHAVHAVLREQLADACHDISDGGLAVTLAEMAVSPRREPTVGLMLTIENQRIPADRFLFTETGGFVLSVPEEHGPRVDAMFDRYGAHWMVCGRTTDDCRLVVRYGGETVIDTELSIVREIWLRGLEGVLT